MASRRKMRLEPSLLARACSSRVRRSSIDPIAPRPSPSYGEPHPAEPTRAERRPRARTRWRRALLACHALLGCSSTATPAAPPALDPARAPWNVAAPLRPRSELELLMDGVARVRELERREPPTLASVPREELVERALERAEASTGPGSLEAEARLFSALELVPAGHAWRPTLRRAFEANLWAFFDPERDQIVVDAALGSAARQRVLAHELAHALVDRHFGLAARLGGGNATSDARAALHLLAEGDADAVVAGLWHDAGEPSRLAPELSNDAALAASTPELPAVVQRSLSAAYADGARALRRLRAEAGWRGVDALYRDPPQGTWALLEDPPRRAAPAPPAAHARLPPDDTWRLVYEDVLGEQALRVVLEEWLPAPLAAELASGWDGDRLSLFERPARQPARALVWELRWRDGYAERSAAALRRALRLPGPASASDTGTLACRAHRDSGVVGQWSRAGRLWLAHLLDGSEPARCARLERWARRVSATEPEPGDPGPKRLIGPR